MNISELSNLNANVSVSITLADLQEFVAEMVAKAAAKPQQEQKETYLSISQVCELLNVSSNTLWRWNRDKYLCHTKIGRTPFYLKSDVDKLLLNGKGA